MDGSEPNEGDPDIEYPLTALDRYVFVATVYDDKSVEEITEEVDKPDRPRDRDRSTNTEFDFGLFEHDRPPTRQQPVSTRELVLGARRQLEHEYGVIEESDRGRYRPTEDAPVDPGAGDEPAGPAEPVDIEEALTDPSPSARTVHTLLENEGALTGRELERLSLGERPESSGNLRVGRWELKGSDAVAVTPVEREEGRMRGYQLRDERERAEAREEAEASAVDRDARR